MNSRCWSGHVGRVWVALRSVVSWGVGRVGRGRSEPCSFVHLLRHGCKFGELCLLVLLLNFENRGLSALHNYASFLVQSLSAESANATLVFCHRQVAARSEQSLALVMTPVFLQVERNDLSRCTGVELFALILARCHDLRSCHDARPVPEAFGDELRSARCEFLINLDLLRDLGLKWTRRCSVSALSGWSREFCESSAQRFPQR